MEMLKLILNIKKKKRYLIFVLLILTGIKTFSQGGFCALNIGYGTYSMTELKESRDKSVERLPFDAKVVDDYPGYLYFRPEINFIFRNGASFGLGLGYNSTGSRIAYSDYSGEYEADLIVSAYSVRLIMGGYFINKIKYGAGAYFQIEPNHSQYKVEEYIRIYDDTQYDQYETVNYNINLELGLNSYYQISNRLYGNFNAGYSFYEIYDLFNDKAPTMDWKGLRISIGVSYKFISFNNPEK